MRGWQAILLALLAGVVGLATGSRPIQTAALALLAVLAISGRYRLLLVGDIHSAREVGDEIIPWGDTFSQRITLSNRSRWHIPMIRVTDATLLPDHPHGYVTSLGGRRSVTWEVAVPCTSRGRYRLGPVNADMSDPLGLFPIRREVGPASSLLVLPRWLPLRRCALRLDGFMPGEARGRRGESPPAAASAREYAMGDSISAIHWPATARANQLMTKLFDPEVQTTVWLALDLDGAMPRDTEELLVTAAASIGIYALHRANLRVGLIASGDVPAQLASERGKAHQYRLQEVLAEVHAGSSAALGDQLATHDHRFGPGQVLVLVTARGPDAWETWLSRASRRGMAVRVVAVRDEIARWPVQALHLHPSLADQNNQTELSRRLEEGDTAGITRPAESRAADPRRA
jgi:uncharacterized protein (DUF58 family)